MSFPTHALVFLLMLLTLGGCTDVAPTGWQAAERVEFSFEGDARGAQLALNRQGRGMVVWEQRTGSGQGRIHARAVAIDGAHGTIATLGEGSNSPNFPDVAINNLGHAVAVWTQGDGRHAQVWARTFHANDGWGQGQPVSGAAGPLLARPRAAINDAGELAVVWMQFGAGTYRVFGRHFSPDRGWSAAVRLDQSPHGAALPQVSLDAQGRWMSTWHQHGPAHTLEVWAQQGDTTGARAQPVQMSKDPGALPALALLGDGSTALVWQRNTSPAGTVGLNRFHPEVGWGEPLSVTDTDIALAHEPAVAAWGAQHAVTAWMQTRADRIEVWATHLLDGRPGTPQPLQRGQQGAQRQARIGAADNGTAMGMWTLQAGNARSLWATVWPAGGTPGLPQRLDHSETGTVVESTLGVDADGQALAVWTQGEEGRTRLWVRRMRTR